MILIIENHEIEANGYYWLISVEIEYSLKYEPQIEECHGLHDVGEYDLEFKNITLTNIEPDIEHDGLITDEDKRSIIEELKKDEEILNILINKYEQE